MNETQSVFLEALKIILDFFSNNWVAIIALSLLYVCRDSISNFISRLTSLTYKRGDSEVGMRAFDPNGTDFHRIEPGAQEEKPAKEEIETETEVSQEKKEDQALAEMFQAFDEEDLLKAEAAFRKYATTERDGEKLEANKALYLYLRFDKTQDKQTISDLEILARHATNEKSKFNTLMWLSFCFRDGMQYHKESEVWKVALSEAKSDSLKTTAIVNLSDSLVREEKIVEAKEILNSRLRAVAEERQKGALYEALSKVEESLGNKSMSIYCKDKSLEFDPTNKSELFKSAYAASEGDIDEISISNYVRLIKIDENNSAALNNLGIRAQEAGFKIKAVEEYKKSAKLKHTLSMANQGFLLLEAGFAEEAEKIGIEALKEDEPHQNVHSLLASISERREKQEKEWDKLCQKSLKKQKQIREYTELYYTGDPSSLEGDWLANGVDLVTIKIRDGLIDVSWNQVVGMLGKPGTRKVYVKGRVNGATIDGVFGSEESEIKSSTLLGLGGAGSQQFIAYLSVDKNKIVCLSKSLKQNISLYFNKAEGLAVKL